MKVETVRAGLFQKARMRPELVRQALKHVRQDGIFTTYKKAMAGWTHSPQWVTRAQAQFSTKEQESKVLLEQSFQQSAIRSLRLRRISI